LFPRLYQASEEGIRTVVMEVSSHSLVQEKLQPLRFSGAGFTSFSRDHLDFHADLASYWQAKWLLFRHYLASGAPGFCHVSLLPYLEQEDLRDLDLYLYGTQLAEVSWPEERKIALTITAESALGSSLAFTFQGTTYCGTVPLIGVYNCENFLCSWLLAYAASRQCIAPHLWEQLPAIPGRLQRVALPGSEGTPRVQVFIDYAHTPDALTQALSELRRHCPGKLWVVFGCGGERDQGKRKIMGQIASELADVQIVTADNPRGEEIAVINAAILSGFPQDQQPPPFVFEERRAGIRFALTHAGEHDVVLIAGKGHETTQTIGAEILPFDDHVEALHVLEQLAAPNP
jgi:UDP-N-acetylmuramoyl-L-alanyl-D-glutamate--2,6-diaminopimelate ligase